MNVKIIILISKQARERMVKDKFVKENKKIYYKEIYRINRSVTQTKDGKLIIIRPLERIGEFNISPRGNSKIRVAWNYNIEEFTNNVIIYICDYLYHITDKDYVDKWNKKAANRIINFKDYNGFEIFDPSS